MLKLDRTSDGRLGSFDSFSCYGPIRCFSTIGESGILRTLCKFRISAPRLTFPSFSHFRQLKMEMGKRGECPFLHGPQVAFIFDSLPISPPCLPEAP